MTRPHQRARRGAGLAGLLGAVGLLVALKQASDPTTQRTLALPTAGGHPTTAPHATSSGSTGGAGSVPGLATAPAASPAPAAAGVASPPRQITGAAEQTPYGPIQVRLTLDGTRIAAVTTVQSPGDRGRSVDIAQQALPELGREVIAAQSARIDTVSGASYDSQGYAQSVQSALDRARS